ncbi:FAD/NAD(P)-binding domain containing protein [Trema orientale]|uniref:FAD/NAD(P)-binding domain containing protein n=1 Tax=Trema orientale TaxID=63057 RepID=A0A2P5EWP6_TREOI|nr:FAD/NAD(P)-binding domain containing protein [Trema orientale]
MLEALSSELPSGTIRYSSNVVAIEESGFFKLVHLVDGTVIKTKVRDALHPTTPDLGQGGCAALEDGVVLARCLGEALLRNSSKKTVNKGVEAEEYKNIEMGLKKYGSERRWRSFDLIATAYVVGYIQQSDGKVSSFSRDKFLAPIMAGLLLKKAAYDSGKLTSS